MIRIIVACDKNRVIGKDNRLPWHLPTDLKRFKEKTTGGIVVMGKNTHMSIIDRLGMTLPNRKSIILSTSLTPKNGTYFFDAKENVIFTRDTDIIIRKAKAVDMWIIGGQRVYEQFINLADEIHMTEVIGEFEGDAYFPEIDYTEWEEISTEVCPSDEKNSHDMIFRVLRRNF